MKVVKRSKQPRSLHVQQLYVPLTIFLATLLCLFILIPTAFAASATYFIEASGDDGYVNSAGEVFTTELYTGHWNTGKPDYADIYERTFMRFNTAALDDACSVISAQLYVYSFQGWSYPVNVTQSNWTDPLDASDYNAVGSVMSTFFSNSGSWSNSAVSPGYVSKTGYTYLALTETDVNQSGFYSFENGSLIPYLVVTYTTTVPSAPTAGTPSALSTTSIRWNFTDTATDERGFNLHDGLHNTLLSQETVNLSFLNETGLNPNTQYTRHVHAYNDIGDSIGSADMTRYTLSDPPTLPVASDFVFNDHINVSWNASPTANHYHVYRDGIAGVGTLVYNANGTSFDDFVTGAHTYYIYSVNNDDVVNTAYITDSGSSATVPSAPNISLVITPLSTSSLRWNFTDTASNESGFVLHDNNHNVVASNANPNLTYLDETGLSANTQYTRHVHAYNVVGESLPSASRSKYTLPAPPINPVASNWGFSDRIRISWGASPASSNYFVYRNAMPPSGAYVYSGTSLTCDDVITGSATYYIYTVNPENDPSSTYITATGYAPMAPTAGTAIGWTSSIRWNFTDTNTGEDGFKVHDAAHNVMATNATPDATYVEEIGLAPNTSYTRHIHAYKGAVDSPASGPITSLHLSYCCKSRLSLPGL